MRNSGLTHIEVQQSYFIKEVKRNMSQCVLTDYLWTTCSFVFTKWTPDCLSYQQITCNWKRVSLFSSVTFGHEGRLQTKLNRNNYKKARVSIYYILNRIYVTPQAVDCF